MHVTWVKRNGSLCTLIFLCRLLLGVWERLASCTPLHKSVRCIQVKFNKVNTKFLTGHPSFGEPAHQKGH